MYVCAEYNKILKNIKYLKCYFFSILQHTYQLIAERLLTFYCKEILCSFFALCWSEHYTESQVFLSSLFAKPHWQSDMRRPLFSVENLEFGCESSTQQTMARFTETLSTPAPCLCVSNLFGWNRLSSGHSDRCQECNQIRCCSTAEVEVRGGC